MKAFNRISAYTSRFAVIGPSREVARDYGTSGIRVNVVSPSTIDSPVLRANPDTAERLRHGTPIGRLGDGASYVTGAVLPVDGAMTA
jgi:NAD(P)-dependent dehydrogenase (short-subunit alcohol dehydrogenase family)